jgi:hypothetical protein
MAGQWRAVVQTAATRVDQASSQPLGRSFIPAFVVLHDRTEHLTPLLAPGAVVPWQDFDLDGPTVRLRETSRDIAQYTELHNRVVRLVSVYGRLIGVLPDLLLSQNTVIFPRDPGPRWLYWVDRRADALGRIQHASRTLREAAALNLATVDAFDLARNFPDNSPSRNTWLRAAENLSERAEREVRKVAGGQMPMASAARAQCRAGLAVVPPP